MSTLECLVGIHDECPSRDTCECTCHRPAATRVGTQGDRALGCAVLLASAVMTVLMCIGLYTAVRWML